MMCDTPVAITAIAALADLNDFALHGFFLTEVMVARARMACVPVWPEKSCFGIPSLPVVRTGPLKVHYLAVGNDERQLSQPSPTIRMPARTDIQTILPHSSSADLWAAHAITGSSGRRHFAASQVRPRRCGGSSMRPMGVPVGESVTLEKYGGSSALIPS